MKKNWFLKYLLPLMAFHQFGVVEGADGGGEGGADGGDGNEGGNDGGGDEGDNKPPAPKVKTAPQISDAEAKLLKEVMDKKNALKKQQEALAAAEEKLKRFDGIDPDAVRVLLAEKDAQEAKALEAKGDWERLKSKMAEEHNKDKATLVAELEALREKDSANASLVSELTIGGSFSQSEFIREELALTPSKARIVYGSHFSFDEGNIVGYDKPVGAKDRTMLVDAQGDPMPFEAALRKIVDADPDRDRLLLSKVKTGAKSGTVPKTPAPDTKSPVLLSGRDKIAAALSKGALVTK